MRADRERDAAQDAQPVAVVFRDREIDYWTPIDLAPAVAADHTSHFLNVVARLGPGVSLAAANDDMHRVAKELEREFPSSNTNVGAVVVPLPGAHADPRELHAFVKERIAAFREAGVTNLQIVPVADDPAALVGRMKEWVA
jgi:hypothetical protein